MISASRRNRRRLPGSSAWRSRISLSATSRCSSPSRATKTAPRPPRAWGRRMRNRRPSGIGLPMAQLALPAGGVARGVRGVAHRAVGDRRRRSRRLPRPRGPTFGPGPPRRRGWRCSRGPIGRPKRRPGSWSRRRGAQVPGDESFHRPAIVRVKGAAALKVLSQGAILVEGPCLEGADELAPVDESVLERTTRPNRRWQSASAAIGKLRATASAVARATPVRHRSAGDG